MKTCYICLVEKPFVLFQKDSSKNDGHRRSCKDCTKQLRKFHKLRPLRSPDSSVTEKQCNCCSENKPIFEFNKARHSKDGFMTQCRKCQSTKNKVRYSANSHEIKQKVYQYYHSSKQELMPKRLAYQKKKTKQDPFFKVRRNLRNRLYYGLKNKNWKKDTHFTKYIGCDRDFLIQHIEKQFLPGMTWENYSNSTWHIDHHIPLSSASTVEDLYKLCHYSNLTPMWAADNRRKSNKVG